MRLFGGRRKPEQTTERFKNLLILIIASILVHNVITEQTKQHVFVSNKLKSIEANESISLFRLSMCTSYVTLAKDSADSASISPVIDRSNIYDCL